MSPAAAIFLFLTLLSVLGILFAFFEKLLNHRAEMARIQAEAKTKEAVALDLEIERLHTELREVKARLDEQAILVDDLRAMPPALQQRIQG